jgi:hypothetical protein
MYTVGDWGMVAQMAVGGYSPNWRVGDSIDGNVEHVRSWQLGEVPKLL